MDIRRLLLTWNAFLEPRLFLVVFAGLLLGWYFPQLYSAKKSVPYLFGYMTLCTALHIGKKEIASVVRYPRPIILLFLLSHVIMPLFSWGWSSLFFAAGSPFAVGTVLIMTVPMAIVSIIWSSVSRGEPALALSSVVIDSLLSPMIMPASIWLLSGRDVKIDAVGMMSGLAWMIVLPTIVGVLLNDLSHGQLAPRMLPINGILSKLCLGMVIAVNMAAARDVIFLHRGSFLLLFLILFVQTAFGFALGCYSGKILGYSPERIRTFTYCVGLRNISVGIVVALGYFPPLVAIPVVLSILIQQPIAALLHRFLFHERRVSSGKRSDMIL